MKTAKAYTESVVYIECPYCENLHEEVVYITGDIMICDKCSKEFIVDSSEI